MNNDQYNNIIELMKIALEFYGNEDTYVVPELSTSRIKLDKGTLARFTLDKVQKTISDDKKLQEEYNDLVDNSVDTESIMIDKVIKAYKHIEILNDRD